MRSVHTGNSLKRPSRPGKFRAGEWLALAGACAVIGPVLLAPGCSSGGGSSGDAPNSGLEALASGKSGQASVRTEGLKAEDRPDDIVMSEVFERAAAKKAAAAVAAPTPFPAEVVAVEPAPVKAAPARPAPEDPSQKVQRLAGELRTALADRAGSRPTFADAAAGTALDAVATDTAGQGLSSDLSPGQRRVIDAFRGVVRALASGSAAAGDPRTAANAFSSAAAALEDTQGLHVRRAVLCSRVTGFGRYEAMARAGFVAGRPARFIVYTELDRFAHRAARESDPGRAEIGAAAEGEELLTVELTQELSLWHDADGSAQWKHPEQTVVEVSRNRRRDFYLVQQVELPANLSVGKYNLKVSVRDRVSGAVDEAQIPIVIVADPALTLVPGASR